MLDFKVPAGGVAPGDLLIAEPLLKEEVFRRAVVMVLDAPAEGGASQTEGKDFTDSGVMGLVLNHNTELTLQNLMPDWSEGARVPLFCGGPVEMERLFMLHTLGDRFPGSMEIVPGVFVGGKLDDIVDYINNGGAIAGKMRFFLGYSGWSSAQLRDELAAKVWTRSRPGSNESLLRGDGNPYWRREVERLGEEYRSWLLVPQDPEMN